MEFSYVMLQFVKFTSIVHSHDFPKKVFSKFFEQFRRVPMLGDTSKNATTDPKRSVFLFFPHKGFELVIITKGESN